jgi:hypothetical protein
MSSRLTRLCFTCESAAPAKQAKTVDVIDYNAVMKATKHHDPYVQAMEQLHCITKDLTVSRHSIKASSHGPRAANAAQEDLPQPNQVQQTPLSNTQLPTLPSSTAQSAPKCFKYLAYSIEHPLLGGLN